MARPELLIVKDNKPIFLDEDSWIEFYPDFLNAEETHSLYNHIIAAQEWAQGKYKMYGKVVKTPRLLSCSKDADIDISRAYSVTPATVWTDPMKSLKEKVEQVCEEKFTYAQMNYYRNGNDSIGFHADEECRPGDTIASVSLGATRRFIIKHRENTDRPKYELALTSGSLLLMRGLMQVDWKHGIPKERKVESGRVNVTFRNVYDGKATRQS